MAFFILYQLLFKGEHHTILLFVHVIIYSIVFSTSATSLNKKNLNNKQAELKLFCESYFHL